MDFDVLSTTQDHLWMREREKERGGREREGGRGWGERGRESEGGRERDLVKLFSFLLPLALSNSFLFQFRVCVCKH